MISTRLRPKSTLIVVPWLEGGGAQGALEGILRRLGSENVTMVILFSGNRNHASAKSLVSSTIELGCGRNLLGVLKASRRLSPLVSNATSVYSLMRASHLVLGLLPKRMLSDKHLAASFHQLPSQDSSGVQGKLEDILVKRGVKSAGLITAPSARAVEELIERRFGTAANTKVDHNIIATSDKPAVPPRKGKLERLNLVFAGRLSQQKGLDRIPELLAGVSTPIHLLCLGDGEQRTEIERSIAEVHSPHKVELLPYTADIGSYFDWSDAVFMPSRWELNPLVVWEARARGRGAIASEIDVFEDLARSGPVWTFRDTPSFSSIVERLTQGESERQRAFTTALESVEQLSTRSSIVEYLEV